MTERPAVRLTGLALTVGTAASAALLALGFALTVTGLEDYAGAASTAGIIVLLGTPAAGLVASFVELRPLQPRVALLALVVLAVLAVAAGLAILGT